jgi:hypothetical protein
VTPRSGLRPVGEALANLKAQVAVLGAIVDGPREVPPPAAVFRGKADLVSEATRKALAGALGIPPQADPNEPYPDLLDKALAAACELKAAYVRADHAARAAYLTLQGTPYGPKAAALHVAMENLRLPGAVLDARTWADIEASRASSIATMAVQARQNIDTRGD